MRFSERVLKAIQTIPVRLSLQNLCNRTLAHALILLLRGFVVSLPSVQNLGCITLKLATYVMNGVTLKDAS
jgi:hypothetical protein